MRLRPARAWTAPLALVVVSVAGAAAAQERVRLVFFGDSLSDPGNYFLAFHELSTRPFQPIPTAPYAIGGLHFSNGATWAEQLAWRLHTPASGLPALLAPRLFTNYAVGRARARPAAPVFPDFDLGVQVRRFLRDFRGRAPSGAVYAVWIGSNDLNDALGALLVDPSGAASRAVLDATVTAVALNVQLLWMAGARDFVVLNVADLSLIPAVRALGPQAQLAAHLLTEAYNAALAQALRRIAQLPGIAIVPFDVAALLAEVVADPGAAGLGNAIDACLDFGVIRHAICARPNRYLFWDGAHPTRAGHAIVAREVAEMLAAR
jgi:outer membrane lipase/esterase